MKEYTTVEELRQDIVDRFPKLSNRLKTVAQFVIDHESDFALETLAEISNYTGIQPSAIVRFAKEFGFDGANAMQRMFRDRLIKDNLPNNYRERAQRAQRARSNARGDDNAISGRSLLHEFIEANVSSLQQLEQSIDRESLDQVIALVAESETIHIVGFRRSFPIVTYLGYLLGKAGKRVIMIDGMAGLYREQLAASSGKDMLIAVSFTPYAEETMKACQVAHESGVKIVAISDGKLGPVSKIAEHLLVVHDAEVAGFRSLSSTLCLAQAIAVGYLFLTEKQKEAE